MCNCCACNWTLIPPALLLCNCLSVISKRQDQQTPEIHTQYTNSIPRQLKLCNVYVYSRNMKSPTTKVVHVMIFAPMALLGHSPPGREVTTHKHYSKLVLKEFLEVISK